MIRDAGGGFGQKVVPMREDVCIMLAVRECRGLQCGFCTPGFVMSLTAWLRDNPNPTDDEVREGLSGNFCRSTGHQGIVAAAHRAAEATRESVTRR